MDKIRKIEAEDSSFLRMPWTIEHQLEAYSNAPRHTERHESLYWSWKQLSRWLVNLLHYVNGPFSTYSKHDETHCRAVLHNIECLLGEDEIRRLSPTDCFGILIAVYLHDIGMCVSEDDKESIIESDKFYYSVEEMEESQDPEMREAVNILKEIDYTIENGKNPEEIRNNLKKLYKKKLDVYRAVSLLLREHSRGIHASKAKDKVYEWVKESDESQSGFTMTGIPLRIFLQLAECAEMHNAASSFKDIANTLLECDNGYASDQYHPRFIAVMLMLGDILDVDNNRFNPFVKEMAGKTFTGTSEVHYQKHRAIRALRINPKIISIQADCAGTEELRLLRSDFDWLEKFLQDCNYHWGEIAPDNFRGCLPALSFEKIRLEGQEIPSDLVSSKFLISQRKAFRLLQGANLYSNRFVFLRELLQNATDATKRQYWIELEAIEGNSLEMRELVSANKILPLKRYPIHVDFRIQKRKKGSDENPVDLTEDDFKDQTVDFHQKYELGVSLLIQDSGIGISQADIRTISEVGTSHDRDRSILSQMPEWLRPNGRFGIGLQSVFLTGNSFQCVTRTRRGEHYKITFHSGAVGDGHIDVIPYSGKDYFRENIPYGTCFSVFVPESYREERNKNDIGWIGADPYDAKYQLWSGVRGAAELMRQMEAYLDSQIGEWIFPVIMREFPLNPSLKDIEEKVFPQKELKLRHAIRQPIHGHEVAKSEWVPLVEKNNEWSNWLFIEKEDLDCLQSSFKFGSTNGDTGAYRIEVKNGCIKIWSQKTQCFFCCSPARILNYASEGGKISRKNGRIRIYVKGLFVSEIEYPGNELLEYVDVESDELQDGLQMDRDSLNEKGKSCLLQKIIPTLFQTFYGILQYINRTIDEKVQDHQRKIIHALEDEYGHILEEHVDDAMEQKRILSSFKIRLSKLSRQNYVLFELLGKGQVEEAKLDAAPEKAAQKSMDVFNIMEQSDVERLFCNDLISIVDNDDYVAFDQKSENGKKRIQQSRQRMIRALYAAAKYSQDTNSDYVTIFLQDFLRRLSKIITLIVNSDGSGQKLADGECLHDETHKLTSEQRQTVVRQLSDELQGYVLLYGMFFFYVNQGDVIDCSECIQEDNRPCYWRFINDKIAGILRYAIDKLQDIEETRENPYKEEYKGNRESRQKEFRTKEFRTSAEEFQKALYVRGIEEQTPGIMKYYSMAEILKNENHFAVFSTRQTKQDVWKHLLIHLSPFEGRFFNYAPELTVFDVLNTAPSSPANCVERWSFLDRWNADMIERMRKEYILNRSSELGESGERKLPSLDVWGSRRVWWMIHHYPTLSLGSDREGNNRINVLGRKANTHVFVDARTILLLIERAKECAPKMAVPRFQTTVWDGFAALKVKEASRDVMTITRGVLSDENKENIMLFGLPYNLPEKARLPYDKTNPDARQTTLKDMDLLTLPQLLDYIREAYSNPVEKNWDTLEQQAIINECNSMIGFTPFGLESESDWRLADGIKELYKSQVPEENWDRALTSIYHSEMLEAFRGYFEDHMKKCWQLIKEQGHDTWKTELLSSCASWTQLDLPVNRRSYITLFLLKVYHIELDVEIYPEMEELSGYLSITQPSEEGKENEFEETTKKLCYALIYCAYYAEEEYRTAFLKDICAWWQEEIWGNDPGKENFLRKSAEQTGLQTDELERLYMAQVRRTICSVLSDTESYLKTIKELSQVNAIVYNHLPPEFKEWLQKFARKQQGGSKGC